MSDLICRQAAIDIIEDFPHGDVWNVESMEEMVDRIKQLPPIQPVNCSEFPNNSDAISRQAAIDAMAELQGRASTKAELKGISKAWKRIKELQPIQPEPAQWVQMLINPRMYRCSNCNIAWNKRLVFDLDSGNEMVMKYCPCCGKKMLAEVDYE